MATISSDQLSQLTELLAVDRNRPINEVVRDIARKLPESLPNSIVTDPFYCCTELGKTATEAFIRRAKIPDTSAESYRPPLQFVLHIRASVKWFALAAVAGVAGNRTDALFVHFQKVRSTTTGHSEIDILHHSGSATHFTQEPNKGSEALPIHGANQTDPVHGIDAVPPPRHEGAAVSDSSLLDPSHSNLQLSSGGHGTHSGTLFDELHNAIEHVISSLHH